jgi:hypothetical protein
MVASLFFLADGSLAIPMVIARTLQECGFPVVSNRARGNPTPERDSKTSLKVPLTVRAPSNLRAKRQKKR